MKSFNFNVPLLWSVVSIGWSGPTGRDHRDLRGCRVKGEVVGGLALELPGHHHRPLPVHHLVRGHPHAGGQNSPRVVVAQLALFNISPECSGFETA